MDHVLLFILLGIDKVSCIKHSSGYKRKLKKTCRLPFLLNTFQLSKNNNCDTLIEYLLTELFI